MPWSPGDRRAPRVTPLRGVASGWATRPVRRALRTRALAVLAAVVVTAFVAGRIDAADRARREWGATTQVLVVTHDLAAGRVVGADDVDTVTWPTALVPSGALAELPTDQRLTTDLAEGEVLLAHRLGRPGDGEWASLLDPGEVAVQLPLSDPAPGIGAGDRVDVVAPLAVTVTDGAAVQVEVVADDARVLEVHHDALTVAVRSSQSSATAGAALGGLVSVVVRP